MKYKIIGNKKVMDKEKGETITIEDEDVAKSLIKGGHIEPTTIKKNVQERKTAHTKMIKAHQILTKRGKKIMAKFVFNDGKVFSGGYDLSDHVTSVNLELQLKN